MAALGALAAGVAHEINNPLSSVCANLDFLVRETARDPALAEVVGEARDGAERVRDVVRGLRAFSSARASAPGPADVRAELDAAIRLALNEIRHRARLELRLGDLPLVAAGAHELGQVFLNLLLNAAQAIPEGHAQENVICVEAGRAADGSASIRIRDTGVGIPPHVLERIFEPFYTTKPLGVGMGLGLAIAHRIVTAAGGRIEVETQVGQGTTFHVTLPAAGAGDEESPPEEPPTAAPVPPGGRRRVLVVDDDALVIRSVARTLAERYEIVTASSAVEALARVEQGERFDALLCDLMMPEMTGMELHARLAERAPALARRMLFITGGAFTEAAARFLAEGRACVEKPFEPEALRAAVERIAAA
jgi:CheY-like chemotaxis protein